MEEIGGSLTKAKECKLEKASRLHKAKTGVGCDGFHSSSFVLDKRSKRIVEFFEKVGQSGKWPQQACTTMFFLIPKNVTSERPIAPMPKLISAESTRSGEMAAEVSC